LSHRAPQDKFAIFGWIILKEGDSEDSSQKNFLCRFSRQASMIIFGWVKMIPYKEIIVGI